MKVTVDRQRFCWRSFFAGFVFFCGNGFFLAGRESKERIEYEFGVH